MLFLSYWQVKVIDSTLLVATDGAIELGYSWAISSDHSFLDFLVVLDLSVLFLKIGLFLESRRLVPNFTQSQLLFFKLGTGESIRMRDFRASQSWKSTGSSGDHIPVLGVKVLNCLVYVFNLLNISETHGSFLKSVLPQLSLGLLLLHTTHELKLPLNFVEALVPALCNNFFDSARLGVDKKIEFSLSLG